MGHASVSSLGSVACDAESTDRVSHVLYCARDAFLSRAIVNYGPCTRGVVTRERIARFIIPDRFRCRRISGLKKRPPPRFHRRDMSARWSDEDCRCERASAVYGWRHTLEWCARARIHLSWSARISGLAVYVIERSRFTLARPARPSVTVA